MSFVAYHSDNHPGSRVLSFLKGVELILEEARRPRSGAGLGVRVEAVRVLLHQLVQRGPRAVALEVERRAVRCLLPRTGQPASRVHDGLLEGWARTVSSRTAGLIRPY